MKVRVNEEACIGCGACQAICEDVFEINDEGVSQVKNEEVENDFIEDVQTAIDSCPTSAIEEIED